MINKLIKEAHRLTHTLRSIAEEMRTWILSEYAEAFPAGLLQLMSVGCIYKINKITDMKTITEKEFYEDLEREQKSSWSEDDEAILEAIIQDIQERHPDAMWGIDTSKTAAVSTEFIIKFLKSLKPQY